ncbi:response regulator [Chitinophaga nivalis]|uniref:Response regulator n=1 Tax=Chitinophaga nivalis TaxID=2991709 RepID=A0ABT3IGA9_9BACT|nr:response regulator [Chitinophaga nivalis]MCW3467320.1 response regulator [Chitinophaga nivalis]MCW3482988.1 response regulator [Chitinophaga nivalis]
MRKNTFTCLLIDDDLDDQEMLMLILKEIRQDITCITAGDGQEALDMLYKEYTFLPDMIFLDLNMPRMDGKECLHEIRKIERLLSVPVMIYSTSTDLRDMNDTRNHGANGYIVKQPNVHDLKKKLEDILLVC